MGFIKLNFPLKQTELTEWCKKKIKKRSCFFNSGHKLKKHTQTGLVQFLAEACPMKASRGKNN